MGSDPHRGSGVVAKLRVLFGDLIVVEVLGLGLWRLHSVNPQGFRAPLRKRSLHRRGVPLDTEV